MKKGFTLVETVWYIVILGIVMTLVTTMMISGSQLFTAGNASVDIQQQIAKVFLRVSRDLEESDPSSVAVGYVTQTGSTTFYPATGTTQTDSASGSEPQLTTAIIMLSARGLQNGQFDYSGSNACPQNPGSPCWQTWICYYLSPNPSAGRIGTLYKLYRAYAPVLGSGIAIGSQTMPGPTTVPGHPESATGWETLMRNKRNFELVATSLNRFCITNPVSSPSTDLFTNPYDFDVPSKSTISVDGTPYYWINIQGVRLPGALEAGQARNTAQVVIQN